MNSVVAALRLHRLVQARDRHTGDHCVTGIRLLLRNFSSMSVAESKNAKESICF